MPGANAGRSGATWRRVRAEVLAEKGDTCIRCGKPGATTVDHYPVSRADAIAAGRLDLLEQDKGNLWPAHLSCNSSAGRGGQRAAKRDRSIGTTSREW